MATIQHYQYYIQFKLFSKYAALENTLCVRVIPCVAKEKYLRILLEEDYTVVIVDQVKNPKNPEVFRRKVVDVVSPSTYIEGNFNANNENYLIMLYTDKHKHIGISAIKNTRQCCATTNTVHETSY